MRRYINQIKAELKDQEKYLAEVQKQMTDINAQLEKVTDPLEKGNLKVDYKLLELNETDTKTRISDNTAHLAE
jgi:predicted  nucleic acid-binding Zn-ribbon protein